jgi:hypothetical protein
VNELQVTPLAVAENVKLFADADTTVPLNCEAVPVSSKPCEATSPCAVAFTVAVWPLQVMLEIVAAEAAKQRRESVISVFMLVS